MATSDYDRLRAMCDAMELELETVRRRCPPFDRRSKDEWDRAMLGLLSVRGVLALVNGYDFRRGA